MGEITVYYMGGPALSIDPTFAQFRTWNSPLRIEDGTELWDGVKVRGVGGVSGRWVLNIDKKGGG